MNIDKPIDIIIADDHKIFIEGLTALLHDFTELHIVATASNGKEVMEILKSNHANVVVTDINMPVMDGMKLTKELKKKYPDIKILALTMHNEGRIISGLLKAGVNGYVLKDAGKNELLEAIKTVARGENYFSEEVKNNLTDNVSVGNKEPVSFSQTELSERETAVLKLIAEGLTQLQIAEKLFISEHTVIFHKRKLFSKFEVNNTAGLIKSAMDMGFIN
ncbi:MAG: response regulator [Flavobacteriales bacterium]